MKKSIISILAGIFLIGCQITEIITEVSDSKNIFTAEMEAFDNDETKTSLDQSLDVLWSEGDLLTIFRGCYISDKYQIDDKYVGKPYGDFHLIGEGLNGSDFSSGTELPANIAIYPYNDDYIITKNIDGDDVSYTVSGMNFPSEQMYSENSFADESFLMAAVTTSLSDHKLRFKNIGGALKLQLKGTGTIKNISIKGNNNESLAGTAELTVSSSSFPVLEFTSLLKEVILNCGTGGVSLKSSETTNFIISLPAVNFTKGFTVTITDINGNTEQMSTSKANNVQRSGILKMPEKTVTFESITPENPGPLPMYIGYIPYETLVANDLYNTTGYGNLTENIINEGVSKGEIKSMDAQPITADYTGFGDVPQNAFTVIIIPRSSELTATSWNVIEKEVPFTVNPCSNGENTMKIGGETYLVFGERAKYTLIKDEAEVYYKIKPAASPMYWGIIPTDKCVSDGIVKANNFFDNMTATTINDCVASGSIFKVNYTDYVDKPTSFGESGGPMGLVVLLPQDSNMKAYCWNSLQGNHAFYDSTGATLIGIKYNGEKTITINGIVYELYGQINQIDLNSSIQMYFIVTNKK